MIKKVDINNFGLFSSFIWKDKMKDKEGNEVYFQKENIIYGRNYSGKTTLSRIFRALETKSISDKFDTPQFNIELNSNGKIDQNIFQSNDLIIRVFNEDFVKTNLKFISNPNEEITPFAILGNNIDIQSQIDELQNELGNNEEANETSLYKDLKNLLEVENSKKSEWDTAKSNLNSQLTNKATSRQNGIKYNEKFGDPNYNITKLNSDITSVISTDFTVIDSDKKELNEKLIKEETKSNISLHLFNQFAISSIIEKAKELLARQIVETGKITTLLQNAQLNNWVRQGVELHSNDGSDCKCGFCGNTISPNRWSELEKHFDEETQKLERELDKILSEISIEKNKISLQLNSSSFYSTFENEAKKLLLNIQDEYDKYKIDLQNIERFINERKSNIFKSLSLDFTQTFNNDNFNSLSNQLSELIEKHNDYSNNLVQNQRQAKEELRLYEVKRFVDEIQYQNQLTEISGKDKALKEATKNRNDLDEVIKDKETEIKSLKRQLNNEEEGAKKVNHYLSSFFGHENLSLEAIEEDDNNEKKIRFVIKRNDKMAYHLSEGECSLVAFCYFMAKLDDVETSGQKPIIYIDDPISSLDSNHIFYVYSLINSELFHKDRFEQIFISTHNLEFLKYIKKLKFTKNNHQYFILNRSKNKTDICLMPSYLKNYITEFNFLFHQIYKCANDNIVDDSNFQTFYNFGNNARKFLEILLSYKYPNAKIEGKLSKYFDHQEEIQINRVNNEFSHLIGLFERGNNIPENNFTEMQKVAKFILQKIEEKDKEQYEALLESIGELKNQ